MANVDSIRHGIVPNASADEVNSLLWCCSPYPFRSDLRKLRRSIRKCLRQGGGTISGAIDFAHRELDAAMAEHNKRRADGGEG
jgi:hypothetical protein